MLEKLNKLKIDNEKLEEKKQIHMKSQIMSIEDYKLTNTIKYEILIFSIFYILIMFDGFLMNNDSFMNVDLNIIIGFGLVLFFYFSKSLNHKSKKIKYSILAGVIALLSFLLYLSLLIIFIKVITLIFVSMITTLVFLYIFCFLFSIKFFRVSTYFRFFKIFSLFLKKEKDVLKILGNVEIESIDKEIDNNNKQINELNDLIVEDYESMKQVMLEEQKYKEIIKIYNENIIIKAKSDLINDVGLYEGRIEIS